MTEAKQEWFGSLVEAKNSSQIPFGDIDPELDGPAIIREAAKLQGVDPPEPGTPEFASLIDDISFLANREQQELLDARDVR